jgi:hypothetical protein
VWGKEKKDLQLALHICVFCVCLPCERLDVSCSQLILPTLVELCISSIFVIALLVLHQNSFCHNVRLLPPVDPIVLVMGSSMCTCYFEQPVLRSRRGRQRDGHGSPIPISSRLPIHFTTEYRWDRGRPQTTLLTLPTEEVPMMRSPTTSSRATFVARNDPQPILVSHPHRFVGPAEAGVGFSNDVPRRDVSLVAVYPNPLVAQGSMESVSSRRLSSSSCTWQADARNRTNTEETPHAHIDEAVDVDVHAAPPPDPITEDEDGSPLAKAQGFSTLSFHKDDAM